MARAGWSVFKVGRSPDGPENAAHETQWEHPSLQSARMML